MRNGLKRLLEEADLAPQCRFAVDVEWRTHFAGNAIERDVFAVEMPISVGEIRHGQPLWQEKNSGDRVRTTFSVPGFFRGGMKPL